MFLIWKFESRPSAPYPGSAVNKLRENPHLRIEALFVGLAVRVRTICTIYSRIPTLFHASVLGIAGVFLLFFFWWGEINYPLSGVEISIMRSIFLILTFRVIGRESTSGPIANRVGQSRAATTQKIRIRTDNALKVRRLYQISSMSPAPRARIEAPSHHRQAGGTVSTKSDKPSESAARFQGL